MTKSFKILHLKNILDSVFFFSLSAVQVQIENIEAGAL